MKVSVEVLQSACIRLQWYYLGKQYIVSTGTKDSLIAIASAKKLAAFIESDIVSGNFGESLLRYKL